MSGSSSSSRVIIFQETVDGIFLNVRFTLADDDEEKTCDRDLGANVGRRQASLVTYEKKSPAEAEIHGSEEPNFVEESKNNTSHHCHLTIVGGQELCARLHNDRSVLKTSEMFNPVGAKVSGLTVMMDA